MMDQEMIKWVVAKLQERGFAASYNDAYIERLLAKFEDKRFGANENFFEKGYEMGEVEHEILRCRTEYYLTKALESCLIDLNDPNLVETPKRIAKMWMGDSLECDTELGGGRFSKMIRLPVFPAEKSSKKWIDKKVKILASCSHHFVPFFGEAEISYMPDKYLLGISKIQRIANYVANRFWLQEDLTEKIAQMIADAAQVDRSKVIVKITAKHGCEMFRGVKNPDSELVTEA